MAVGPCHVDGEYVHVRGKVGWLRGERQGWLGCEGGDGAGLCEGQIRLYRNIESSAALLGVM